jgi:hypothetical protein
VCDNEDAHSTDTLQSLTALDETLTAALGAATNSAPPAALLPPGLQEVEDVDAKQPLKLQRDTLTRDSSTTAADARERSLGYAYDWYTTATAPPNAFESSDASDVMDVLEQLTAEVLDSSTTNADTFRLPTTLPALSLHMLLYEYAPSTSAAPPPQLSAPLELRDEVSALQLAKTLLDMSTVLLLIKMSPETLLLLDKH